MKPRPPTATLFPYTTLFRSRLRVLGEGRTPWRHRVRPAEDGVPREKARGAVGTHVAHAEVIVRSEEHTSELQSLTNLVCRLLLEKKINDQKRTSQHATPGVI